MQIELENFEEKQVSSKIIHQGKVLTLRHDEITLPDGNPARREVLEHPGGVVVIPVLPNGNLLLVRQYRYAISQHLLEFPAGKLEKGEDPFECAKRELEEETGYHANTWIPSGFIYTAPGFCNEKLYFYIAKDLVALDSPNTEDDEFIQLIEMSKQDLKIKIDSLELVDAKTIAGFLKLDSLK